MSSLNAAEQTEQKESIMSRWAYIEKISLQISELIKRPTFPEGEAV